MKMTTLCYLEKNESFLMLHRVSKKNDENKDKWIGVGGHFEDGESPEECALREVREETGYTMTKYFYRGIVTFVSDCYETEYMHLFTCDEFIGNEIICDEGNLCWVPKDKIMDLNLWEGDKIIFELLDRHKGFFSLKLTYKADELVKAVVDGKEREFFDILNESGQITNKIKERSLCHREGTFHKVVHTWIVRPNEYDTFDILLQKRSMTKDSNPGCYDISSAGHIMAGNEVLPSAIRELKEELGIQAELSDLEFMFWCESNIQEEFYGQPFLDHELAGVYVYKKPVDETTLNLQKEEVESVCWMEYEECLAHVLAKDPKFCIHEEELLRLKNYVKF